CIQHPTCQHGSDCPAGLACDPAGRCVECFYSADCGANRKCLAGVCADACATSATCTAPTGSCDMGFGACVSCLNDTECPTSHYCNYGRCELKTCTKGEQFCLGADVLSCQADGHSLITARTCLSNYTCVINGGVGDCVSNVPSTLCTAGDTKCDGDTQLT